MKRLFLGAITALSLLTIQSIQAFEMHTELDFSLGYRRDSLHVRKDTPFLDLVSFGTQVIDPVIIEALEAVTLQESLSFKSLDILYLDFGFRSLKQCSLYVRSDVQFGWILNSSIHDKLNLSVDLGDIPLVPGILAGEGIGFSLSTKNPLKNSYIVDFNFGIGYPFFFLCGDLFFSPMIGYTYDSYTLRVRDYNKPTDALSLVSLVAMANAIAGISEDVFGTIDFVPDSKKSSYYKFSWYGPWIGFDTAYNLSPCLALNATVEYHLGFAHYKRRAHSGFTSLDHVNKTKSAQGYVVSAGLDYDVFCMWNVGIEAFYRNYRTFSNKNPITATTAGFGATLGYTF